MDPDNDGSQGWEGNDGWTGWYSDDYDDNDVEVQSPLVVQESPVGQQAGELEAEEAEEEAVANDRCYPIDISRGGTWIL
jgi:hypothetical protein